MNLKGSLTLLILNALAHGPSHGYRIAQEIKKNSKGVLDFKEGTLYPTLHNMEREELVETYSSEENGRVRRYYKLTELGKATLIKERKAWQDYVDAVNLNLETNL
jgi:DNA-binding PadR family transcriptional regulator